MRYCLLFLLCLFVAAPIVAQEQMSSWVGQRILRIKEFYGDNPQQALENLQRLEQSSGISAVDRGYVVREEAALLIQAERYGEARDLLWRTLADKPGDYVPFLRMMLAQLYLNEGDTAAALPLMESWLQYTDEPHYSELSLLGYGYLQVEQYARAVSVFERILQSTDVRNDQWYELLAYAYVQTDQTAKAVGLLDTVITEDPADARWWRQLSNVFLLMEEYPDGAASLAVAGLIDELTLPDARRLAGLFSVLGMPADGAEVFDAAIARTEEQVDFEDYMLLGELYVLARENDQAISVFRNALQMSDDGEPAVKIAQLHMQWERYEQARQALLTASERYSEAVPDEVWYLLAVVDINLDDYSSASSAIDRIDPQGSYAERSARLASFILNQASLSSQ